MAVVASATGAAVFGLSGVAAGLAGGALLGAGIGGLYSAVTGDGNVLNSMLTGGVLGATAGGIGAAAAPAAAGGTGLTAGTGGAAGMTAGSGTAAAAGSANTAAGASAALNAGTGATAGTGGVFTGAGGYGGASSVGNLAPAVAGQIGAPSAASGFGALGGAGSASGISAQQAAMGLGAKSLMGSGTGLTGNQLLGYGLAGSTALSLLGNKNSGSAPETDKGSIRPYTFKREVNQASFKPLEYDAEGLPIMPKKEENYFNDTYTPETPYKAADGGLMSAMQNKNMDFMSQSMYPTSQQQSSFYAAPSQSPMAAQAVMAGYEPKTNPLTGEMTANMAAGGMTYDPKTQQFNGGLSRNAPADVDVIDRPQWADQQQQSQNPSDFFGGAIGYTGDGPSASGNYSGAFSPSTSLYKDELGSLTSQWQAANPYAKSYDPKTQKYGAGNPTNSQLLAYKNAQAEEAYKNRPQPAVQDDQRNQAANGGLMSAYNMGGDVAYNLGSYSDGGRLLKGPGDGVSDDIPAVIGHKQPARLAEGEFVIPSRIVSEIGNGSTDAGAKRLYAMMDKIQAGRKKTIGKGNVAKDTKAKKHLLA